MNTPDVNVLLYAVNLDAPQYSAAAHWIEDSFSGSAGIAFTWHALTGFLRLSTQPRIIRSALPLDTALAVVDEWLSHPRARIIGPTDRHASMLGRLLIGAGRGGNLVSDAHLAAIAIEHGAVLGTFDRDFERFAGLRMDWLQGGAVHDDSHARLRGSVPRFDDPLSPVDNEGQASTSPRRARQKRRS